MYVNEILIYSGKPLFEDHVSGVGLLKAKKLSWNDHQKIKMIFIKNEHNDRAVII